MEYSKCQPVQQFMSKYPNINIVDIVTLCKEIVSIKNEPKTVNMDDKKDFSSMTVKELRVLGKQYKVKKYYSITKEQLIAEVISKQPEPEPQPAEEIKTTALGIFPMCISAHWSYFPVSSISIITSSIVLLILYNL